jgi:hypothetical protein
MSAFAVMVAQGYRIGAPTEEAEDIDAQIAERMRCRKCGSPMRYEGYYKRSGRICEYVALAVCDRCSHVVSF